MLLQTIVASRCTKPVFKFRILAYSLHIREVVLDDATFPAALILVLTHLSTPTAPNLHRLFITSKGSLHLSQTLLETTMDEILDEEDAYTLAKFRALGTRITHLTLVDFLPSQASIMLELFLNIRSLRFPNERGLLG